MFIKLLTPLLIHLQVYLQMKVLVEVVYLVLICSLRG